MATRFTIKEATRKKNYSLTKKIKVMKIHNGQENSDWQGKFRFPRKIQTSEENSDWPRKSRLARKIQTGQDNSDK